MEQTAFTIFDPSASVFQAVGSLIPHSCEMESITVAARNHLPADRDPLHRLVRVAGVDHHVVLKLPATPLGIKGDLQLQFFSGLDLLGGQHGGRAGAGGFGGVDVQRGAADIREDEGVRNYLTVVDLAEVPGGGGDEEIGRGRGNYSRTSP